MLFVIILPKNLKQKEGTLYYENNVQVDTYEMIQSYVKIHMMYFTIFDFETDYEFSLKIMTKKLSLSFDAQPSVMSTITK